MRAQPHCTSLTYLCCDKTFSIRLERHRTGPSATPRLCPRDCVANRRGCSLGPRPARRRFECESAIDPHDRTARDNRFRSVGALPVCAPRGRKPPFPARKSRPKQWLRTYCRRCAARALARRSVCRENPRRRAAGGRSRAKLAPTALCC